MVHDFEYYLKNKLVKKSSKDVEEAKALSRRAGERLKYVRAQEITDENAAFIFEDVYEAMREAIQSLMAIEGFKPYSHEVLVSFLNKFYSAEFSSHEINSFDRYRIIRNNVVYRASSVNKRETERALEFALEIIAKIKSVLG